MIVDAHCHLVKIRNYQINKDLLPVTAGYSHSSNVETVRLAKKLGIPFVLGIAPQTAIREDLSGLGEWVSFICENQPNAIGEIGLDYHWAKTNQDIEKEKIVYTRMLELAEELDLPVVLHARKSTSEVLDFLSLRGFRLPFMLHFFSGSAADAGRIVGMGGFLSFPPVHSSERKAVISSLELQNMLVESDAPYVGRTPEDTKKAISYIAEVKNCQQELVVRHTTANATKLFRIGE